MTAAPEAQNVFSYVLKWAKKENNNQPFYFKKTLANTALSQTDTAYKLSYVVSLTWVFFFITYRNQLNTFVPNVTEIL